MRLAEVLRDSHGAVFAEVSQRGTCAFLAELTKLEVERPKLSARVWQCIVEWCTRGKKGYKRDVWRDLSGTELDEWRIGKYRVFWYNKDDTILITGWTDKKGRRANAAIQSAQAVAKRYQQALRAGEIEFVEPSEVEDADE
jgi:hypothetical protein